MEVADYLGEGEVTERRPDEHRAGNAPPEYQGLPVEQREGDVGFGQSAEAEELVFRAAFDLVCAGKIGRVSRRVRYLRYLGLALAAGLPLAGGIALQLDSRMRSEFEGRRFKRYGSAGATGRTVSNPLANSY